MHTDNNQKQLRRVLNTPIVSDGVDNEIMKLSTALSLILYLLSLLMLITRNWVFGGKNQQKPISDCI